MSDIHSGNSPHTLGSDTNREQELADGVLDRTAGEHYNPEPADVVAEQRARFDAANERLHATHDQLEQSVVPVINRVKAEADAAAELPEHQAMIEHQIEHDINDPKASYAGKERQVSANLIVEDHLVHDISNPLHEGPNGPAIPVRNDSLRKDR